MINKLSKIKNYTKIKRLTRLEKDGLNNDLEIVYQKLIKNEYRKGFFSVNKFDVDHRTEEILTELEFYALLGRTWARILKELRIEKYPRIVDLCPGFSPKIEIAAFYLNYPGQIVTLDISKESTRRIRDFIKLFQPEFSLAEENKDLFKNYRKSFDFVIANHVIDDLVLYYFAKKLKIEFSNIYKSEASIKKIWDYIDQNKQQNLEEVLSILTRIFSNLINKKGYLCIAHYKSYSEKLLDLDSAYKFNMLLLKKIVDNLCRDQFINDRKIVNKAFANFKGHFGTKNCYVLRKVY